MKKITKFLVMLSLICILIINSFLTVCAVPQSSIRSASNYDELVSAVDSSIDGDIINITDDIIIKDEITLDKAIGLNGNGCNLTVPIPGLDEAGQLSDSPSIFRVFKVSASGKTVEINNVHIKGGKPTSGGGAIYISSNTILELNNCEISNSGGSSSNPGGGLANYGITYLNGCNISRNAASHGGGFLNYGTMLIENSTFSENRSLSSGGGGGAGESQGNLYINNSTFTNNISTELGSALNLYNSDETYVLNSTFTGNVNDSSGYSGVIRSDNADKTYFINSIFAYNYSTSDGGDTYNQLDFDSTYTEATLIHTGYHEDAPSGVILTDSYHYTGSSDGTDNSLVAGGTDTKLLASDGTEKGSASYFQPYLVRKDSEKPPVVMLKPGSFAYDKGIDTAFKADSNPTIAYKDTDGTWIYLKGSSDAETNKVLMDQLGNSRDTVNAIGSTVSKATDLCMLKVLANMEGRVTGGSIYGDVYPKGISITLNALPNDSKIFKEWRQGSSSGNAVSTDNPYKLTINEDTALYPVYESGCTVIFKDYDERELKTETVQYGRGATPPENPIREGYTFTRWDVDFNNITSDLIVKAQYSINTYQVTFETNGGSEVEEIIEEYNKTISEPIAPTKEDYIFGGWYKEPQLINQWSFESDKVPGEHITLYAKWLISQGSIT